MISDIPLIFLASVAIISLSGVMMPGPVFAATMAQGYRDKNAGLKIALGHAMVEIPLIALIFLGLATVLSQPITFTIIGLLGGTILLWMGIDMIRSRKVIVQQTDAVRRSAFLDGIFTTITNPYWLLWWATVGAALIATATTYGIFMLPIFTIVHLSCDAVWNLFLSNTVNRTKGLWDVRWHHVLIMVAGGIIVFFGIYFLASSLDQIF